MQFDFSNITKTKIITPPRIVLYGPEKVGKSTFASQVDGALYFDFEEGSGHLSVRRAPDAMKKDVPTLREALRQLRTASHDFSAVVIDTADWLEARIHDQVAAEAGKKQIDDIGYGAGYNTALNIWRDLCSAMTALTEIGLPILVIAHSQIKRYDNPLTESYDRHQLKLHGKSAALLTEWCDCLLFANQRVFVDKKEVGFKKTVTKGKGGDIVLHTAGSPAFQAGNRYGLPPELDFSWGAFIDAFNEANKE